MQCFGPHVDELGLKPRAHLRVRAREVHLVEDRLHVEPGATHNDDRAPAGLDLLDARACSVAELHHAHLVIDAPHIEHVMGYAAPLGLRHLGGADIHADVNLHRVRTHDLGIESLGEVDRNVGLAHRGRPDDGDDHAGDGMLGMGSTTRSSAGVAAVRASQASPDRVRRRAVMRSATRWWGAA